MNYVIIWCLRDFVAELLRPEKLWSDLDLGQMVKGDWF